MTFYCINIPEDWYLNIQVLCMLFWQGCQEGKQVLTAPVTIRLLALVLTVRIVHSQTLFGGTTFFFKSLGQLRFVSRDLRFDVPRAHYGGLWLAPDQGVHRPGVSAQSLALRGQGREEWAGQEVAEHLASCLRSIKAIVGGTIRFAVTQDHEHLITWFRCSSIQAGICIALLVAHHYSWKAGTPKTLSSLQGRGRCLKA